MILKDWLTRLSSRLVDRYRYRVRYWCRYRLTSLQETSANLTFVVRLVLVV